jgi:hypothetical protein
MKQQLSLLFADKSVSQIFSALGFYFTDASEAQSMLAGVHGHDVKVITREAFEAMPDEDTPAKPVVTLADKLAKLDSKGIQALVEKQASIVNKKNEALDKLKKQGDRMDANKFAGAKDALEKEVLILNQMTDALSERVDEEKAQALLETLSKTAQNTPETTAPESTPEATQEATKESTDADEV